MRNKTICLLLVLSVLLLFIKIGDAKKTVNTSADFNPQETVLILDAGHGGEDGGAVASDGTNEKDINLSITLKLKEIAQLNGYDVILTRNSDNQIYEQGANSLREKKVSDMKKRLSIMNSYPNAVFVSIHLNKFNSQNVHGTQVFYAKTSYGSKELANCIQNSVASFLQNDNKKVPKENTDKIFLLKNATVPAVIVECGFLSNQNELKNLKNNEYQYKISMSIFLGIVKYLNTI